MDCPDFKQGAVHTHRPLTRFQGILLWIALHMRGDERVAAAGGRGTSFAAPLRGLLHFVPSHDILRHRFAITCLSRAPSRYIGPRVDKPAPTQAAPPIFSSSALRFRNALLFSPYPRSFAFYDLL